NKDENLLYQLQVVFGNLQENEKWSYDASQFYHAYKDRDGKPLGITQMEQMDVDELINGLFDCLEKCVSETSQAMLVKEHFGGLSIQQIKSKDCGHVSEKEEPFYVINCEIKDEENIEEGLELFIEDELLNGGKFKLS